MQEFLQILQTKRGHESYQLRHKLPCVVSEQGYPYLLVFVPPTGLVPFRWTIDDIRQYLIEEQEKNLRRYPTGRKTAKDHIDPSLPVTYDGLTFAEVMKTLLREFLVDKGHWSGTGEELNRELRPLIRELGFPLRRWNYGEGVERLAQYARLYYAKLILQDVEVSVKETKSRGKVISLHRPGFPVPSTEPKPDTWRYRGIPVGDSTDIPPIVNDNPTTLQILPKPQPQPDTTPSPLVDELDEL